MKSYFRVALFIFSLWPITCQAADNQLTEQEQADGWLLLFDGETMFGWKPVGKVNWAINDGVISASEGEVSLLRTTTQFSDYIFTVDFRADVATNSGIFLRTSPKPAVVDRDCYELNIAPQDNPFPTGSFVGRKKLEGAPNDGEWHHYEVSMNGGNITVKLDGEEVLVYDDPKPLGKGYIGLQHNSGKVEFKNVKLKPLGLESIYNGKDLSGWKTYPDTPAEFSVADDGTLSVKNGRGPLETESSYADFVLQLDCQSHGEALNSGVFFRCIPGDVDMNGYESQIQNGYKDNDRTKPVDCGTGGIFRRVDARRVVSDDFKWFRKTIIADGPHFSVWVNGFQVTDWTDKRKADENPRRGLRTKAGSIMIQAHDPTTDLSFRRLEIRETPARWK